MLISNYKLHNFVVATLHRFGLSTQIGFTNKTDEDYHIVLHIRNSIGESLFPYLHLGRLYKTKQVFLKDTEFLPNNINKKEEFVYEFSLLPITESSFLSLPKKAYLDIEDLNKLKQKTTVQDQQLQYSNNKMSFGVLYSLIPVNYSLQQPSSLLIHVPKIFISDQLNTLIQLINYSILEDYSHLATLNCRLLDLDGNLILKWKEIVAPNGTHLIDIKRLFKTFKLKELILKYPYLQMQAVCDSFVIPLVFNHNEMYDTWTVEHSVATINYHTDCIGLHKNNLMQYHKENW